MKIAKCKNQNGVRSLSLYLLNLYFSIATGLIPRSLLRQELLPDLLESVIPECFYRESKRDPNWTPDKNIRG